MELTQKDRLILINQYEILKRLDPKTAEQSAEAIEILKNGYSQLYGRLTADVAESDMCCDKCQVVSDVIGAYKALGAYISKNSGDKEVSGHPWAKFRGFHPGTEGEYLGYARFLESATPASAAPTLSKSRIIAAYWAAQGRPVELTRDVAAAMLGLGGPAAADEENGESAAEDVAENEAAAEAEAAPAETKPAAPKAAPRTRKASTAK